MLDSSDESTLSAVLELRDIQASGKPIVIWIGAGASRWSGYPTWDELAQTIHSAWISHEPRYNRVEGLAYLTERDYPSVFSLAKATNTKRYFELLRRSLTPRPVTPVYERLIEILRAFPARYLATTNVDETLEAHLSDLVRATMSNAEQASVSLAQRTSFLLKAHGTAADIERSIWTREDYAALKANTSYLSVIRKIIEQSHVIFLGYGLRDQYLVVLWVVLVSVNLSLQFLVSNLKMQIAAIPICSSPGGAAKCVPRNATDL